MAAAPHTLSELRAGRLAGIRRLDLSCGLTAFPPEIFELADSLEILNLSDNRLHSLPDRLPELRRLKVIFLSQNNFTQVPPVLGACPELRMIGFKSNRLTAVDGRALTPALRWLILTDNRLTRLPEEIGRCAALQKLMLAGNRLKSLPESMAACRNLELIRLAANELEILPDWLLRLPRLAWLALAGNPCLSAPAAELPENPRNPGNMEKPGLPGGGGEQEIPQVPWERLTLEARLGEGASGVIHRAGWSGAAEENQNQNGSGSGSGNQNRPAAGFGPGPEKIAVKIFKGAVTSDGLPSCEMAACLAAGAHPNLIGVRGRVTGHPDGADALIMPLIPSEFRNLAGPPGLESCTRDLYPDGFRISLPAALRLAEGMASAAAHLHGRGIMHGDLYAHNILWRDNGDGLLGDFGAASRYHPANTAAAARALERIEVRAFGCLLEELLTHSRSGSGEENRSLRLNLGGLMEDCLRPDAGERPSFAQIRDKIRNLRQQASA